MSKITYEDKEQLNTNENIPAKNKCMASDLNEIKSIVNENDTNALYNTNVKTAQTNSDTDVYSCNYINEIGSCACFSKTDSQNFTEYVATQISFNQTDYVDNGCFELQSDGTIKVLKDISRVQINFNIRIAGSISSYNVIYCKSTTDDAGFNVATNFSNDNDTIVGAGILKVQKNDIIRLSFYTGNNSIQVNGYNKSWCSINLCVIK